MWSESWTSSRYEIAPRSPRGSAPPDALSRAKFRAVSPYALRTVPDVRAVTDLHRRAHRPGGREVAKSTFVRGQALGFACAALIGYALLGCGMLTGAGSGTTGKAIQPAPFCVAA